MKRAFITLLILLVATCFSFDASFAKEDKSLKELDKEIKAKQKELDEGKKQEEELFQAIVDLEEQVNALEAEIANGQIELEALEEQLEETEAMVAKQNEDLATRLRSMYKNGSVGFLDVLLHSGSFSDFLTNVDMVQRVYESDEEVLTQMQEAQAEVERQKADVEALQGDLASAEATTIAEIDAIATQKEELAKANAETQEAIDDLEAEMENVKRELAEKASSGKVSTSDSSKYEGGAFLWPTPGHTEISSEYGWRQCPFHGREFHAALDIAAPEGADVVASADGEVVYAGWYGGFGNSVLIDHGGGIVSQYSHCSSVNCAEGDKVKKGQTVAKVGSTGFSTGPHLDYRVYVNGEVVNPREYL